MLTDDFQLVSYVLDMSDIKVTHTSDMLRSHLHNLLNYYEFVAGNAQRITYTFNAINLNDIHEEDMECQGEVTFVSTETDVSETQIDEDATQELQSLPALMQQAQSNQHSIKSTDSVSSVRNHVFPMSQVPLIMHVI